MACPRSQDGEDLLDGREVRVAQVEDLPRLPRVILPHIGLQLIGHLLHRHDVIRKTRDDRASGHAVVACRLGVLDHAHPARAVNRPHPEGPVGTRTREDNAYGLFALVLCQGAKEKVDGHPQAPHLGGCTDLQNPAENGHVLVRRDHIDAVGLHGHAVLCLDHVHGRVPLEQLRHHAGVAGVEMDHQDESHVAVRRHVVEEGGKGLEAPRRCPHADDGKGVR